MRGNEQEIPALEPEVQRLFAQGGAELECDLEETLRQLLHDFQNCPQVRSGPASAGDLANLREAEFPAEPLDFDQFVTEVLAPLVQGSSQTSSPRCLGNMTGPVPAFIPPLAQLVARINQNMVKSDSSRQGTPCERQTLALLHRLTFGGSESFYFEHGQNPRSNLGSMASGGSLANLAGLWCARQNRGRHGGVILASEMRHYSIDKAADILGLDAVCSVQVDDDYRLCPRDLDTKMRALGDKVVAVVGVAGATVTGALDPLPEITDLARRRNVWCHVDAAWGGGLMLSPTLRGRLAGIERADSVVLDAHKQFYLPVGLSALLFRDPRAAEAIQYRAGYMLRDGSDDLGRWSLEGSRPWMSLLLYCAFHLFGKSGYAALVEQNQARAEMLAEMIQERPEFELIVEPRTPQVVYRLVPHPGAEALTDRMNIEVQEYQRRHGVGYVSRSTLPSRGNAVNGPVVLRAMLTNPLTSRADLEAILDEQVELARRYLSRPPVNGTACTSGTACALVNGNGNGAINGNGNGSHNGTHNNGALNLDPHRKEVAP